MTHQESLYGKTPDQLAALCGELGMPRFAARQIARWLYVRHTEDPLRMTDIAAAHRQRLAERFSPALSAPERVTESADGTKKYLFRTLEGHYVESAYIPDGERATLCVSSPGRMPHGLPLLRHGAAGASAVAHGGRNPQPGGFAARARQTHEPRVHGHGRTARQHGRSAAGARDNHRRVGFRLVADTHHALHGGRRARIAAFSRRDEGSPAVSLHNPFHEERMEIMPVERAWPIAEVAAILREYDFTHQRRVSFEYIVMSGLNDSPRHIRELTRLLNGIKCRINLIRFHRIPDSPYFSPGDEAMVRFRDALTARGIQTTIRASRGEDIQAACGLLSTRLKGGI